MSSSETKRCGAPFEFSMSSLKIAAVCGAIAVVTAGLGGCAGGFQPLYGATASTGTSVSAALASVDINTIPGRVGQQVRNELIFKSTGGGETETPLYRLEIVLKETAESRLILLDGDVSEVVYGLASDFQLVRLSDNAVLHQGRAAARAPYDKVQSIFANIRARRDAEDRAARNLADNIRTQVAAVLSKAG